MERVQVHVILRIVPCLRSVFPTVVPALLEAVAQCRWLHGASQLWPAPPSLGKELCEGLQLGAVLLVVCNSTDVAPSFPLHTPSASQAVTAPSWQLRHHEHAHAHRF